MASVSYIESDDHLLVLGDEAMEVANMFGREGRRPLKAGLISPDEIDSLTVLGHMVKDVLGEPSHEGEHCYFSIPAPPVDVQMDVVYHKGVFTRIVEECGFTAHPANEAMAIVFSKLRKRALVGLGLALGQV